MTPRVRDVEQDTDGSEEPVVAGIVVFALLAVVMLGIMLYGVFTESRRR